MALISAYKPLGLSPLDVVKKIKEENPELEKVAYAGRLDPMAEGVILLVYGEDLSHFHQHLKYDKEYEGSILFGFSTDTYDLLGISQQRKIEEGIKERLLNLQGEFNFPLPPYSSYRVQGAPLFKWAREGRISEIDIPYKKTYIYSISLGDIYYKSGREIEREILEKINKVKGDFRQEEIKKRWREVISEGELPLIDFKIKCSSGCYMRSVAEHVGGTLFHLKRTAIDF